MSKVKGEFMTKSRNEWKILLGSMNSVGSNMFAFIAFYFNVLLNLFNCSIRISKTGDVFQWTLANIWMMGTCLYFLRLFYNKTSPRFAKTVPCAKKIYTRNLSIAFGLFNTGALVLFAVYWFIFYVTGRDVHRIPVLFLMSCIMHLAYSIGTPLATLTVRSEEKITMKTTIIKNGKGVLNFIFPVCLIAFNLGASGLAERLFDSVVLIEAGNTASMLLFAGICCFIIIVSWVLNRKLFYYTYKK